MKRDRRTVFPPAAAASPALMKTIDKTIDAETCSAAVYFIQRRRAPAGFFVWLNSTRIRHPGAGTRGSGAGSGSGSVSGVPCKALAVRANGKHATAAGEGAEPIGNGSVELVS